MLLVLGGLREKRRRVFIMEVIKNVDRLMKRVKEKLEDSVKKIYEVVVEW